MRWNTALIFQSSTRIELLGWRKHSPESLNSTAALLQSVSEIPLNEDIIRQCICFRQKFPIKLPDAIIAATALYAKLPLMTRDIADFERIPELRTVNPFISIKDE